MACVFLLSNMAFAAQTGVERDTVVKDVLVSQDEYIRAVAEHEKISYSEAETEIENARTIARVAPESVVTIQRSVTKRLNSSYTLKCTAYLDVARDNRTNNYIEILNVKAPYVDLVGPSLKSTMSGSTDFSICGTKATIYCNGTITYALPTAALSVGGLGVSLGTNVTGDRLYRYDVSTTFVFVV